MKNLVKLAKRYREDIIAIELLVLIVLFIMMSAIVSFTKPLLGLVMFVTSIVSVIIIYDIDLE